MAKTPTKKLKITDYIAEKQKHLAHVEAYFSRLVKRIGGEVATIAAGSPCEPESLAHSFALGVGIAIGNNGSPLSSAKEYEVRTLVWSYLHQIDIKDISISYDDWVNEETIHSVCLVEFFWASLALKVGNTFGVTDSHTCTLEVRSTNDLGTWSPAIVANDDISIRLPLFAVLDHAEMATYRNLVDGEFAGLHSWLSTTD